MKESPLHHFELHPIGHLELMGIDISLNKGIFWMWAALVVVFCLFLLIRKTGVRLVPGKMQSIAEMFLLFLRDLVDDFIGKEERKFFPFAAALFFFILSCNLIGSDSRVLHHHQPAGGHRRLCPFYIHDDPVHRVWTARVALFGNPGAPGHP